jgi:hypothetical protein
LNFTQILLEIHHQLVGLPVCIPKALNIFSTRKRCVSDVRNGTQLTLFLQRVFTDANLFDSETLLFIDNNVRTVHDFLRAHAVQLEPGVDLVLDEYIYSDQSKGCQYYFVNHRDRCVFWMDKAESIMFPITQELNGITSASHIRKSGSPSRPQTSPVTGHELEAQYWWAAQQSAFYAEC